MSISSRLLLGFGVVIIVMALLGFYGVSQIARVRDAMDRVVARDFEMLRELENIYEGQAEASNAAADALRAGLGGAAMTGELDRAEEAHRAALARTTEAVRAAADLAREFGANALSPDRAVLWRRNAELLLQIERLIAAAGASRDAQFRAIRAGQIEGAVLLEGQLNERQTELVALINQMQDVADQGVEVGRQRITRVYNESQLSTLAAIAIAVVVAGVITYLIRRSIVAPVQGIAQIIERVGHGELSGDPAATGADEIGRLGGALNAMVVGLRELATQSREVTSNLGAAITEIRASTQEQAASVEEQLAAVQETAATVDEMAHAGSQVAKRAQDVIASAQATAQTSADGLKAVDETSRAMDTIREQAELVARTIVALSERTEAISEIISSVNDISERSHLLALNAAIEAAAAGESGRSFSVVASEMKVLADQAKEATSQVRAILGDVQRGINTSVMLTEEAVKRALAGKERTEVSQRTIGEITQRFQESVLTFQQIVASTNQQQLGIEQVMGALQNIRQASQQTAAGTRQLNEAASSVGGLSEQLLALVARYKL